jgi:hypothetical protein
MIPVLLECVSERVEHSYCECLPLDRAGVLDEKV